MLFLAVEASVRVAIYMYVCSVWKCTSQFEVEWNPVFEMRFVSKPVRPMLRYGSIIAVEKIN
jgi:hypothetical protein